MGNRVLNWQSGIARNRSECDPRYQHLWDGLVGAWYPKLGPTGATLRDVSGHHNHGVLTNMEPATDWVLGEDGWALNLDGATDYVSVPSAVMKPCENENAFSVAAWVYNRNLAVDGAIMGQWGANPQFILWMDTGDGADGYAFIVRDADGGSSRCGETTASATADVWQHVVGTWDGKWVRVYVDGAQVAAVASPRTLKSGSLGVGIGSDVGNAAARLFPGMIESVYLSNHPLSAAEIRTLYETRGNCLLARPDYGWLYGPTPGGTPYYYNYLNRLWGEA